MQNKLRFKNIIAIFCFGLLLTSCASFSGQLSYFDENTYDNLTKLKPRVSLLYQSFGEAKLDLSEIRTIRLLLAQAHEYEKGKGSGNVATAKQFELILKSFEDHIKNRLNKGPWAEFDIEDFSENMNEFFNIAISTEGLKNRQWNEGE